MRINCDFPGGNGHWQIDSGNRVITLSPDQRDSHPEWFYWAVRIDDFAGETWTIQGTQTGCITSAGPASSRDAWLSWDWLDSAAFDPDGERCTITGPPDGGPMWLALAPPYTLGHWQRLVAPWQAHPAVTMGSFGSSAAGRPLPMLQVGPVDAQRSLVVCARHHCCEMQANRVIDGLLTSIVEDETGPGRLLRDGVRCTIAPFIDLDGAENGDQGKYRQPHDHNRDHGTAARYPETAAFRDLVRSCGEPVDVLLDVHCPWSRGAQNDSVFLVGSEDPANTAWQRDLLTAWARHYQGPLPLGPEDLFPFGKDWNQSTATPTDELCSCGRWARHSGATRRASTIEVGYGMIHGHRARESDYRDLGAALAAALAETMLG